MSQDTGKPTALPVAEALVALAAVGSASELETKLEEGRAVLDERTKKSRNAAERKEINRQAKGVVPALIYAHGASTASDGTRSEIMSSGVPDFIRGVIKDAFPGMPEDGPSVGFPVRHLRSKIRELHKSGEIDEHQMKVLICAVRKANNEIAGENPKARKTGGGAKKGNKDKQAPKGHVFRGPREIQGASLNGLPARIRSAANRLKEKPTRQGPPSYAFSELLLADCALYFEALELACNWLGRRLTEYAEALKAHEHSRGEEDKLLEWMVQAPVEPPETVRALLADRLDWVQTRGKDE
jgi:hypothetical protein